MPEPSVGLLLALIVGILCVVGLFAAGMTIWTWSSAKLLAAEERKRTEANRDDG